MRTKGIIIDSGAYSVWNKGRSIDLGEYIGFCKKFPDASYYVNLDVIPGTPGQKNPGETAVEEACKKSWRNYQTMTKELPKEKILPVFHQRVGEDVKWLEKYLADGASCIGVGGVGSVTENIKSLSKIKKYLFDHEQPLVRIHGFGVSSFALMKLWSWYSVDSSTWVADARWGLIYIPKKRQGVFDFSQEPFVLAVSPRSSLKSKRGFHLSNISPTVKSDVMEFLALCNVNLGKFHHYKVERGHKLAEGENWYHRKNSEVMVIEEPGIIPSLEERMKVNIRFLQEANKVLPVKKIYFAGNTLDCPAEYEVGYKLASFPFFDHGEGLKILTRHIQLLNSGGESFKRNPDMKAVRDKKQSRTPSKNETIGFGLLK